MNDFGMLIWYVAKFTNSEFDFTDSKLNKLMHIFQTKYKE